MADIFKVIFEVLPPVLGCMALFVIGFAASGGDLRGIRQSVCWILISISVGLAVNAFLAVKMLTGGRP